MSIVLKTEKLRNLQRIWSSIRIKGTPYYENVLLDFENKKIAFRGPQSTVKGNLEFETEGNLPPLGFIDGSKFFSLVQFYDELVIDENGVFSSSGNSFEVPYLDETDIDMADRSYDDWMKVTVNFDEETGKKLSSAISCIDPSDADSTWTQAVYLQSGTIITASHYRMYFSPVDNADEGNLTFPSQFAKLLPYLHLSGDVDFLVRKGAGDSTIIQVDTGEVWIRYYCASVYVPPVDFLSDEFTSSYNHPNYVSFRVEDVSTALKFLFSYLSDSSDPWTYLEFRKSERDEDSVVFHLEERGGITNYVIPLTGSSDFSYFKNRRIKIQLDPLRLVTGIFSQAGIVVLDLSVDFDSVSVKFSDNQKKSEIRMVAVLSEED